MSKIRIDLHVHSDSSYDCRTKIDEFRRLFEQNTIDRIAITDHSVIDLAFELKEIFGDKIIIGEEIKTSQGEIIGLFLTKEIAKNLSPQETIQEIRKQNGVVYIPHPFDSRRSGIGKSPNFEEIMRSADIIEVFNSRCFTKGPNNKALDFASKYKLFESAASDAHTLAEIGRSFVEMEDFDTPEEFLKNIQTATLIKNKVRFPYLLSPTLNKLKKKFIK